MNKIKLSIIFTAVAIVPIFSQINDLAKTPPMGWNSWNVFHENINETQIKEIADVMVSSGMKDAGYIYLNLDDNWMAKTRNANGDLQADPTRFPSGMKALGDYIHEKGLKFGIYGDRGLRTCHHYNNSSQFPNSGSGSYMKEERDAKIFASWGVDYIKYDNCEPAPGSNQKQDYERMRDALLNSGRDIVFSICAWGYQDWMPATGNLWRTTGDIGNAWKNAPGDWFRGVADIIEEQEKLYLHAGPGRWNDPDMLQVGNGKLTDNEARSQMTMWSMMAAPLLTGNDIRKMSEATKQIYMNADMIAVDQDSVGIAGHRVKNDGGRQVWMRPLGGEGSGKLAVALYNSADNEQTIDLNFTDVGVSGEVMVRDVWQKKDLGIKTGSLSAVVAPHHVTFLILASKVDPAEPFGEKAIAIPGKLEVENFDKGSSGLAYSDNDIENQGNAYREGGVDVVGLNCAAVAEGTFLKSSDCEGFAIGYTNVGEWMRYTVNIAKTQKYYLVARVSSGSESSSFLLFLNDKAVTDTIKIPQGADWDTYTTVSVMTQDLTQGEQALKLQITGSYANVDWLRFCAEQDCADTITTAVPFASENQGLKFNAQVAASEFNVFSVTGKFLGRMNFTGADTKNTAFANEMKQAGYTNGVYIVRAVKGEKALKIVVKE